MGNPTISVIRGGRVLDLRRRTAPATDILIEGDTIRDVGAPGMEAPPGARAIDASDRLVIPGLVNAHTHGHGSFAKGMGDRWSLELLLNAGPWISGSRTLEDKYLATLLNAAEMLRKGCTAAYDLTFEFPAPTPEGIGAVARAYADIGLRAVVAPMMADRTLYQAVPGLMDALPGGLRRDVERVRLAPHEASLAACRRVLHDWQQDRARIRPALAPTIPHHCSDEFWTAARDVARDYEVGLHTHLAESKVQAIAGMRRYNRTLAAHLDSLGVLGPRFTGAHGVWLDEDDMRRLADRGASIAHNPGSNLRLGSGVAPVRRLRDLGVNVGIGSDGSSSSDNQNMFEAMRTASFVSRVQDPDTATWLSTDEAVEMATEGGARALGFGDAIGRIAPGFKADLVFLDLGDLNYVPLNDPVNQIVHCEDGSAVGGVMVGGRMVLEGGRLTTIDEAKLRRDVERAIERLRAASAPLKELALSLEGAVENYCVGLSREPYHVQRRVGSG
jgi:5-methylthioadenosine/S-adenosylhomocysteine deaminase